jgi:hypothetical protein
MVRWVRQYGAGTNSFNEHEDDGGGDDAHADGDNDDDTIEE